MCGICGYTGAELPGLLGRMTDRLRHRGPDAAGFLEADDVHLGARRLRVVDLATGDQPIFNEDGTIGVVFNGEIYGFAPLREELERAGHHFRTRSDTEVLVHLYEQEGIAGFARLDGMYAAALYDRPRRRLVVVRDPMGIKPLCFRWDGRTLVFASEVKSVLLHPAVVADLDPDALHLLLNVRFVPAPRTLFRGVEQLLPGHALVLEGGTLRQERFHRWPEDPLFPGTPEDAAAELLVCLRGAVERQLVADVPVGIFLSGGLDSSAIVAAAATAGARDLHTYTLGFNEPTDELADAELVARHFGARHSATTVDAQPLRLYPRVVWHAEQPKVNATQGFYLSRFAREQVTVALSGLGGDELFLGYDIYRYLRPLEVGSGPLGPAVSPAAAAARWLGPRLPGGPRLDNARRGLSLLGAAADPLATWLTLRNAWDLPGDRMAARLYTDSWAGSVGVTTADALAPLFDRPELPVVTQVQRAELASKLVDDFLLNEDRTSMASSLEVRVPFLDLEVVRFARRLPLPIAFEGHRPKALLRRALAPLLPPETLRKRKWGFTFNPYEQIRGGGLRALWQRELTPAFLRQQGIVRPEFVAGVLAARPSPLLRWHYFTLWQLFGLKLWQELFLDGRPYEAIEERLAAAS
jgi:asparagine synthase (glutamine-hydrolysing)